MSSNPKVHYRVLKSLPPVPILSQMDPIDYNSEIAYHLRPGFPNGLLSSGFQKSIWQSLSLGITDYIYATSISLNFCRESKYLSHNEQQRTIQN